jgi:hypothetical protein
VKKRLAGRIALMTGWSGLRPFNLLMACLHTGQGAAILLLSDDANVPIRTSFLRFNEERQTLETATRDIFDLPLAPLVASFLLISAAAHALLVMPPVYSWYRSNLRQCINYVRWWEYALSASLMTAIIAMLPGMYDLGSLILIFTLNAMMLFFGLLMEMQNEPGNRVNWTPYLFGCIAGAVPWFVIALYLFSPGTGPGNPPTFVYAIFFSLFVWYSLFAINMWLQYRRIGPWRDYVFGEYGYIMLSLTAKSALAWQVFAGALTVPV